MASANVTLKVQVRDLASVKLLYLQLNWLLDDMRVGASPFAERLEGILDRFDRALGTGEDEPEPPDDDPDLDPDVKNDPIPEPPEDDPETSPEPPTEGDST